MALHWNWSEKCGEITMIQQLNDKEETFTIDLYQGNAYLIMIHELGDGTGSYELLGFFNDKTHMRNCLGLNPKAGYSKNIYNTELGRFTRIRLNKAKYTHTKDLVAAFTAAFDDICIELYNADEKDKTDV